MFPAAGAGEKFNCTVVLLMDGAKKTVEQQVFVPGRRATAAQRPKTPRKKPRMRCQQGVEVRWLRQEKDWGMVPWPHTKGAL